MKSDWHPGHQSPSNTIPVLHRISLESRPVPQEEHSVFDGCAGTAGFQSLHFSAFFFSFVLYLLKWFTTFSLFCLELGQLLRSKSPKNFSSTKHEGEQNETGPVEKTWIVGKEITPSPWKRIHVFQLPLNKWSLCSLIPGLQFQAHLARKYLGMLVKASRFLWAALHFHSKAFSFPIFFFFFRKSPSTFFRECLKRTHDPQGAYKN